MFYDNLHKSQENHNFISTYHSQQGFHSLSTQIYRICQNSNHFYNRLSIALGHKRLYACNTVETHYTAVLIVYLSMIRYISCTTNLYEMF
jgi:aminopeptidase-like protein